MTKTKTERDSDFILERTKSWLTVERGKQSLNTPMNILCHLCKLNKEQQFLFIYNLIYQHETPIIYTYMWTYTCHSKMEMALIWNFDSLKGFDNPWK